ncbi:2-phospho-L-lactate guanylyltransferase [Sphingomonas psychrolutea]|uniref:2-phospho-L-lactate guanylyltransferase n=1 Tax=Sphingomonas psychrolutea TaxID=1259676 RepID=A0ABQ1G646_9SPHN|nr:2-phospho-L-lactate guanylyltransferase [Sphingomonas psychrolutea]GGA37499.1 2-phospho-L-lactate guanylyltransferase [Sphingomonas psychrolutea]
MGWTAVVPLKQTDAVKSRLSDVLPVGARADLVEAMARHVLGVLRGVAGVDRIALLTVRKPLWWDGDWADDGNATLNEALTAWRMAHGGGPVLVIHGDLPYLARDDVAALLDAAAATGAAMATDAHGSGTNAIALADARPFAFRFGPDSRFAHSAAGPLTCIDRPGLARDIDTPADLAALIETQAYSI